MIVDVQCSGRRRLGPLDMERVMRYCGNGRSVDHEIMPWILWDGAGRLACARPRSPKPTLHYLLYLCSITVDLPKQQRVATVSVSPYIVTSSAA